MPIINIGQAIWASLVQPGMVVELPDGTTFDVGDVAENYASFMYRNEGGNRTVEVDFAAQVTVIGYFNPENR